MTLSHGAFGFLSQLTQSPDGYLWAGADKQALDAIFKEVKN